MTDKSFDERRLDEIGIGPQVVPEHLRDYVRFLIDWMREGMRIAGDLGRLERHNRFSIYVMEMLYFLTGHRPVRRAFADERNFDLAAGLLLVSDKDREDATNTRLVPLASVALDQIGKYRRYVEYILGTKADWACHSPYRRSSIPRPFIFLIDARNPRVWRPVLWQDLKRCRRGYMQAVSNVQRSGLSTRLSEAGCRDVYIDAVLGHWHSGLNPYGAYSSLSVSTLDRIVRPKLERLADDDGWEEIDEI